jgi:hypothetical protein
MNQIIFKFQQKMSISLLNDALINSLQNNLFVLKTQAQLVRDFAKFNLFFDPDYETFPHTKQQLQAAIELNMVQLMKEGEQRFLQLLYTIDIPENEFLLLIPDPNFLSLLSEKILMREALKVFMKEKFV